MTPLPNNRLATSPDGSITLDNASVQRLMDYGLLHYTDEGWYVGREPKTNTPSLEAARPCASVASEIEELLDQFLHNDIARNKVKAYIAALASPIAGGLPDIITEGERLARETPKTNGTYLWTDLVGAIQTAIAEERARHVRSPKPDSDAGLVERQLNPDVFAGDILRDHYREQMDTHARWAERVRELHDKIEHAKAKQRTAAERATSIMETLARHGGMLPPDKALNPSGGK